MSVKMWEILVPAWSNTGNIFTVAHHNVWDDKVLEIVGGLSLMPTIKGKWEGCKDKMIPVRIACSRFELEQILDFTMLHYNQEAVMACKVYDEVIIFQKKWRT
jgi:hypothetical protein